MLPAEVQFLLFVSGVSNNAFKGQHCSPLHVLCVVSETPKSAGCCGNKMQEHKKPFLSTNPGHRHICQHRNKPPETQPKTSSGFNMGFRPWELMLYRFEKPEFPSSELYMQM